MKHQSFLNNIEKASNMVGKTWPLYSFVTSNPLSGYENMHFAKAVRTAENLLGGNTFPSAKNYRQALEKGEINENELHALFAEKGFFESTDFYLKQLELLKPVIENNPCHKLDRISAKWLSAFMDEGLSEWEMPNRNQGFYSAWRSLAMYDAEIGIKKLSEIPKTSAEALNELLKDFSETEKNRIFEYHLAALPGWTGYIKFREENQTLWQQAYRITLEEYLAVRLYIADTIHAEILPKKSNTETENPIKELQYIFLNAWEKSWQSSILKKLDVAKFNKILKTDKKLPDAQLVFCIDTRSELMRRNVEATGNYETFGFAGFFGIAMDYTNFENGLSQKSCPPIVPTAYQVSEISQKDKAGQIIKLKKRIERQKFAKYFLTRMKNMLPSAFGYVEGSGIFYGFSLLSRTLFPSKTYNPERRNEMAYETSCSPNINVVNNSAGFDITIALEEKVAIVKSAFKVMGWKKFSPLVLLVGHGSHSVNNPFGSSLDCGACAASPGRHNARMFAKLANDIEVRKKIRENSDLQIPDDSVFIGAEHNTTTDEMVLFDSEVPDSHVERLNTLKKNLKKAQQTATKERFQTNKDSVNAAHKKTNNWAETRPEWGLAKNAGFIIGPRSITKNINLESECFLQSYNWKMDDDGSALEGIMQGPMVVTQWINNHYYFSTVNNEKFGGGSKITHNITGRFGVVQGNGGDLKIGLPLQSVNESDDILYHKPLRLSVLIQSPKDRIQAILEKNDNLKSLLENEWIHLLIMDPTQENCVYSYKKGMDWAVSNKSEVTKQVVC